MSPPKLKSTSPNRKLDTYVSAAKEIEQEKQMVAALKRLSIGHLMQYDPDLPGLDASGYPFASERSSADESHTTPDDSSDDTFSSVSSLVNRYSYSELNYADQDAGDIVDETAGSSDSRIVARLKRDRATTADSLRHARPSSFVSDDQPLDPELLWVPANMHPEINPQLYKTHVKATIDDLLEQKISRSLSRSRSKRSSLLFSVTDTDPDESTVFVSEDEQYLPQEQPKKQYTNPSLRELTSELQAMTRLAGMDATDAVTLARTLSSASMGYSDVERLAFDELGNPQQVEKNMYLMDHLDDGSGPQTTRRVLPKLRVNTSAPNQGSFPIGAHGPPYDDAPSVRSPVDEEFALRRSRRPHYRKGSPLVPTSQVLSAHQLGSQLQSNKAGKLAVLRQSLLSSNIANVSTQQRSDIKGNASALPQRDPYANKLRPSTGQGVGGSFAPTSTIGPGQSQQITHAQTRHASGSRYRAAVPQSPYVQSVTSSGHPVPLSPSDSAYFPPHPEPNHGQRSGYPPQMGSLTINQRPMEGYYSHNSEGWNHQQQADYDDRHNVKMRSMSSAALYGYNPNWQNVPMRSSSDLYSNPYHLAGGKSSTRYAQFDYNGYPVHPQQQQQQQQHYYDYNQQTYQNNQHRQKNRQFYGPYNQYAYQQHQGQSQQSHNQQGYHGAYGPEQYSYYPQSPNYGPEQGQHGQSRQQGYYSNTKDGDQVYRQNEPFNVSQSKPKRQGEHSHRDKASKTRETRRELSENLDLLRNEINEFKESLSRTEPFPPAVALKEREKEPEKSDEPAADYSFDLTTHEVSYEDSLGIEKEIMSEKDKERIVEDVEKGEKKLIERTETVTKERLEEWTERKEEETEGANLGDALEGDEGVPNLDLLEIPERSDSRKNVSYIVSKLSLNDKDAPISPSSVQLTYSTSQIPSAGEHNHHMGSASSIREAKEVILSPIIKPKVEVAEKTEDRPAGSSPPPLTQSRSQQKVHKKTSSGLLILKTDTGKKKAIKKPWPWSKDKSQKETTRASDQRRTPRSASSPDLSSKLIQPDSEVHGTDSGSKDNVISKLFKKKRSQSSSGERSTFDASRRRSSSDSAELRHDQRSSRSSEDLKHLGSGATSTGSSAENVKARFKQKLKNITKGHDKSEKAEEPVIVEEPAAEEEDADGTAIGSGTGGDNHKPMSTLEVQDRLKKSIKRTSRANQPIEFTDSAFGFPLPPPSHSTLVMIDYRFPVHVERAIYRLSHLKLANPKRSLREQVLLSNFMYAYLNLVDHTLHLEQMTLEDAGEFTQPDNEMDLLGQQDIDTDFEAESLDEEDFDLIKIDLEIRDQIPV